MIDPAYGYLGFVSSEFAPIAIIVSSITDLGYLDYVYEGGIFDFQTQSKRIPRNPVVCFDHALS